MKNINELDIKILQKAVCIPIHDFNTTERTFKGGVLSKNGQFCELSKQIKGGYVNVAPKEAEYKPKELKGLHI